MMLVDIAMLILISWKFYKYTDLTGGGNEQEEDDREKSSVKEE